MSRGQRGQVMTFVAVALAVVLMPVGAYAIDAATVSRAAAALQVATSTAALEAAQQLDAITFRASGSIVIDAEAARRVAGAVLAAEVPAASITSVTADGAEVTVATGETIRLPFNLLPARSVQLRARAAARLSPGYDNPSSRLPLPTSTF